MLELKKISKSYKTGSFVQQALKEVSIQFRNNEFVAILGASGSGKTTLIQILGLLDELTEGKYYIDGIVDSIIPKLVRTGMNPSDFNRALEALCDVSYKQMEELQ